MTFPHSHEDIGANDPEEMRMNLAYHLCGSGRPMENQHEWKWEEVKDTPLPYLQELHANEHDPDEV